MSHACLMSSIERRDGFSAGRFGNAYTIPWSLSPLTEEDRLDADEGAFDSECPQGNVRWFHGARLVGPDLDSGEVETRLALRFVCHFLIDYISDEGIPEVCQSLREFYDYYKPCEASQRYLPDVCQREAIRGAQLVRPSFTVEGE